MTVSDNHPGAQEEGSTASIVLAPPLPLQSAKKRNLIVMALVLVLGVVLFFLPTLKPTIDFPEIADAGAQIKTNTKDAKPEQSSPLSDAEALVFRREAQDLLVEIVELKNELLAQQVQAWGGEEFASIESSLASAESQYQVGEYAQAKQAYTNVRAQFIALQDSFQPRLDGFLDEADAAIADYRAEDALGYYQGALTMEETNTRALNGLALAAVLPQIQEQLTEAINCRSRQDLRCAMQHAEQALALNADFTPAKELKDSLSTQGIQNRYQAKMSEGFLALERRNWDSARSAFNTAEKILPHQNNTTTALTQLAATREQIEVTDLLNKARGLETQEQWDAAQKIYEKLLRRDSSLVEPAARLVMVKARTKIAARYRRYLDKPMLLTSAKGAREAEQLLRDTASLTSKSSALAQKHQLLSTHLLAMKTPKEIPFRSDGQTEVTVFKVAKLGKFSETTLTLKPGKYVASGNRQGYRDVRVEFVVGGDAAIPSVSIACVDLI